MDPSDLAPELCTHAVVGLELESLPQEAACIVELVPGDRQGSGTTEPGDGSGPQPVGLGLVAPPGEIGVLGTHGVLTESLEPGREGGVQPRAPRLGQTRVGDLARERVLDRVLALAGHGRAAAAANEVALLEHAQVRLTADELVHRPRPEDAPDHGRGLQRFLLSRLEQVDPRRENRLHRVGDSEVVRELADRPPAVLALQHPAVDERREQLLDEERVSLRALDHHRAQLLRQAARQQLVQERLGVRGRERLELDEPGSASRAPAGAPVKELRPRRRQH